MRLLLVGAFGYPHVQGSQIYFQEQAIALRAAGAEVELLTYGSRPEATEPAADTETPTANRSDDDPDRWRALDGFEAFSPPAWTLPVSNRSGPQLGKPFADLCVGLALRRLIVRSDDLSRTSLHASSTASSHSPRTASSRASNRASSSPILATSRPPNHPPLASWSASSVTDESFGPASDRSPGSARPPFDAILAHHAEAAWLALHALPDSRPPVVYCAHTLLEQELPEYFTPWHRTRRTAGRTLAALGRGIDRGIARRSDAWIALTQSSSRVMNAASTAPGRRLAPPVPDPLLAPERPDPDAVAHAHGLRPGDFFLYSGNLDPYQDLPLLEQVGRARRARSSSGSLPIVIATHDVRGEGVAARAAAGNDSGILVRRMRTSGEAQALLAAARASLVPRRTLGGFPIKLANSLAAGTPVVALHGAEWGLVEGRDALIGAPTDPVDSIARALERLEREPSLAARLGAGARATWRAQHDPAQIAAETLALVESIRRRA